MLSRRALGLWLLIPALAFTAFIIVVPIIRVFWMSVHDMDLGRPRRMHNFVGLDHYRELVFDPQIWQSVWVTLIYSIVVTACSYIIGLSLALLLNKRTPGIWLGRMLLALPWAVPGVVASFVFIWMFDSSFGVVNYILMKLGFADGPIPWASYSGTALALVSLIGIWKIVPFVMLTQLAGLQAIPDELYQAARVDGATPAQEFWNVTWPGLSHVRVVTIILTGLVTFREFGQIFVVTGGGPNRSTETMSVKIYIEAFQNFEFGFASALGVVMLLFSLAFTVLVKRAMSSRGVEQ